MKPTYYCHSSDNLTQNVYIFFALNVLVEFYICISQTNILLMFIFSCVIVLYSFIFLVIILMRWIYIYIYIEREREGGGGPWRSPQEIKNMLGLFYTFSKWHHTKSFLHGAVHRSHREPCFSVYIYMGCCCFLSEGRWVWCGSNEICCCWWLCVLCAKCVPVSVVLLVILY